MNLYYWAGLIAFGAGCFCFGVITGRIMASRAINRQVIKDYAHFLRKEREIIARKAAYDGSELDAANERVKRLIDIHGQDW